ncbi:MAG: flippase [Clostridia bacterium]|nr:flippase [Clostridia bacterium]
MSQKSIKKNYIYNLIYQSLTLVLPLVTTPYLSRILGSEPIGIYSYTYSIVSYFLLFGSLGVSLYGQREIAYVNEDVKKRKKIFWEIVACRFVTMFIAILIYFIFLARMGEYAIYYRIWLIELIAMAFDISWFFQGMEDFKKTVIRNVIVRLASVTLIFVFVKSPEDLIKYITIYSIADLVGNLSLWRYLPRYFKGIKIGKIKPFYHLHAIILLFIPQIANQVYNLLDKTMIGKIITDKSEVGFYEQGQKVIRVLLTVVTSLGIVMIPRMASTFASGNKKQIIEYMKKSFKFVFFLAFPIVLGLISVSKSFVPLFFGEGYDKVVTLLIVISPTIILTGMANVIGTQYLLPIKRQKEYTITITLGLVINFFLNYILITYYDSVGASIATVVSELIVVIAQLYVIRKDIKTKEVLKLSIPYIFASLVMFAITMIEGFVLETSTKTLIIQIISGGLVYVLMLWILKDEFLKMFLEKGKSIIKRKA